MVMVCDVINVTHSKLFFTSESVAMPFCCKIKQLSSRNLMEISRINLVSRGDGTLKMSYLDARVMGEVMPRA